MALRHIFEIWKVENWMMKLFITAAVQLGDERDKHFRNVPVVVVRRGNRLGQVAFVNCGPAESDWPPTREEWTLDAFG
jgi:hypothetical protein